MNFNKFRFRVMKDCFFGLLRDYVRVDNVLVRVIDTRIFHSFGENYILRDFQVRECTFKKLKDIGFDTGSEWSLALNQSDLVYKHLDVTYSTRDKVLLY